MAMFCCSGNKTVLPDEMKPLTAEQQQMKESQDAKVATSCQRSVAACCCFAILDRDDASDLVTKDVSSDPSLYQRLCMCQCSPRPRPPSGIEMIPELRGLAGVTLQQGDHETSGSLQTLKWGYFDPDKRVFEMAVFGGFYSPTTGVWTEPINVLWCFLANLGRTANYTYRFEFSEDYHNADIRIKANPLALCGLCCPCIPAWFTLPKCISTTTMTQPPDVKDGSVWDRFNGKCGMEPKFYYKLIEVMDVNGQPGRFYDQLTLSAPKQQMITF
mmetsp:Transcript_27724/g.57588  ORF Transcript_27724/g.57588 Transcript_27724/m.57588 type:complete len:272 (+) Transcript_27724:2-817(+)